MSQFVVSRHASAGVQIIVATAIVPLAEPSRSRRVVAVGRISSRGGQVVVIDRLAGLNAAPAGAGL